MSNPHYRRDIDGLRAFAVTAVLLFHAFPSSAPGGFVGVDVFFAISGFLISGIIIKGVQTGSFRYSDFYARRIRRIFPALTLVLAGCMVLGWLVCFPPEYAALGKHIVAAAGFVSNLLLWRESGYFDVASVNKPLLHLWSLGIEEQFYIVWPLMLSQLCRRTKKALVVLVIVAAASFAVNVHYVVIKPSATFYLPFTRFWELLIGGCLAYVMAEGFSGMGAVGLRLERFAAARLTAGVRACGAAVGLAALVVSVVGATRTAFPGWWATMPTMGTLLIIAAGPDTWINRTIFAHPAAVFVGLISYPLYLWHWPLLTFARLAESSEMSPLATLAVLGLAVVLSMLTYRVLENPIRFGKLRGRSAGYLIASLGVVACCGAGAFLAQGRDVRLSWNPVAARLMADTASSQTYLPCSGTLANLRSDRVPHIDWCVQSSKEAPVAAVFGDSHAEHIFGGLAAVDGNRSWALVGHNSCPPVVGIAVEGVVSGCRERTEAITAQLARTASIKVVLLSFFGNYFLDSDMAADHIANHHGPSSTTIRASDGFSGTKEALFFHGLERAITTLEQAGKGVWVLLDVPELPFFPVNRVRLHLGSDLVTAASISREAVLTRQRRSRAEIAAIQRLHPRLVVWDPLNVLCDAKTCYTVRDRALLFKDSHHLSHTGSVLVAGHLIRSLDGYNMYTNRTAVASRIASRSPQP